MPDVGSKAVPEEIGGEAQVQCRAMPELGGKPLIGR